VLVSRIEVRAVRQSDRAWVTSAIVEAWGSDRALRLETVIEKPSRLPGFITERDGRPAGRALVRLEETSSRSW
jgi:hypothetical protein